MPERHRIAIVTRTFPPRGGGISSAHFSLFHLLDPHHVVKAFAFDDDGVPDEPQVVRRKSARAAARVLEQGIVRYVGRRDRTAPAIYTKGIASIIPACRALSGPLKTFSPDIVIVPDHYVPALALKLPADASVVWVSHHNYLRFDNQPLLPKRSWMDIHLAHRLELRALRKAHHVVCPSHYMAGVFRQTYEIDIPLDVIPNVVHTAALESVRPGDIRSKSGMKTGQKLIYIPSAGSSAKGKRYVFELIRRLGARGDAGFYLSGHIDNDLRRELESLDPALPVIAPGSLSYEENLANVAACDFAVSPTLVENMSSAILEGLLLGVPFVTFDTGGNKELVQSEVNGFVVPYLDVEALVAKSLLLLDDTALMKQFKKRSREAIASLTDERAILSQYEDLFQRLRERTRR